MQPRQQISPILLTRGNLTAVFPQDEDKTIEECAATSVKRVHQGKMYKLETRLSTVTDGAHFIQSQNGLGWKRP